MADDDDPVSEFAEKLAAEVRSGVLKPVYGSLPIRWHELLLEVDTTTPLHEHDNSVPLHKIGRFDVVICRGQGAYGLVFEAIDPKLQRRVALKLCQVHDGETVDDVLAEAQVLAKLNHPNVITIHDAGEYGEDVFFVMEYATGGTADSFVQENDPPWQAVLDIYLGAGAGLAAAHEHDPPIVHGDFKPTNVLVDEGGMRPRVADFGFARIRHEHMPEHEREATLAQRGTLAYAAPEVLRGQVADALADQWSFCASFWESLEGVLPFDGKTTAEMLDTIERMEPRWINASVPEPLREVLKFGLSIDPHERYPSMKELLRALEAVRQLAPPPSEEHRLQVVAQPAQLRRRKIPGWGYSVAGVLVGGLSVFLAMRAAREPVGTPEPTTVTSECAVEPGEIVRPRVLKICRQINDGELGSAHTAWEDQYSPGDDAIADDTLIIARTFLAVAVARQHSDLVQAGKAATKAGYWADALGDEHAGAKDIRTRAEAIASPSTR